MARLTAQQMRCMDDDVRTLTDLRNEFRRYQPLTKAEQINALTRAICALETDLAAASEEDELVRLRTWPRRYAR
jgi:hypothetical protein